MLCYWQQGSQFQGCVWHGQDLTGLVPGSMVGLAHKASTMKFMSNLRENFKGGGALVFGHRSSWGLGYPERDMVNGACTPTSPP